MAEGNWTVGAIIDQRADAAQREALTAIVSGKAGGPPDRLNALMGEFAGVVFAPITFASEGLSRSATAPGLLDQAVAGVASLSKPGAPIFLDNVAHPAGLAACAGQGRAQPPIDAFDLKWDDVSGKQTTANFTRFVWQNRGRVTVGRPQPQSDPHQAGFDTGTGCDTSAHALRHRGPGVDGQPDRPAGSS